ARSPGKKRKTMIAQECEFFVHPGGCGQGIDIGARRCLRFLRTASLQVSVHPRDLAVRELGEKCILIICGAECPWPKTRRARAELPIGKQCDAPQDDGGGDWPKAIARG